MGFFFQSFNSITVHLTILILKIGSKFILQVGLQPFFRLYVRHLYLKKLILPELERVSCHVFCIIINGLEFSFCVFYMLKHNNVVALLQNHYIEAIIASIMLDAIIIILFKENKSTTLQEENCGNYIFLQSHNIIL